MKRPTISEIRRAVADYIATDGCWCCQNYERHQAMIERLGKVLNIPQYPDRSGRDFPRFRTMREAK